LPNLSVVAEESSTGWKPIMVATYYGKQKRPIEIVSKTALWSQALLCTDLATEPEQIILWFVRRLSDGAYLPRSAPAFGI
jgi:hypothetical protein